MRLAGSLLLAACGRIGFESAGTPADGSPGPGDSDGAPITDGTTTVDVPADAPMIGCADFNLGSALGRNLASGSTSGTGNDTSACSGDGPEVTFGWFAPATGSYRIDLCDSEELWDSVMYVRNAACNGTQLACQDDACGGFAGLQPRITLDLVAGQGIVIFVDSQFPEGNYQLAIEQL